ncbi:hypothetical protein HDU81_008978 [Chytriomyces hyalinus]|nr:hypothetical protein HDU81_008978 [Chytriomyces hyalinus]
MRVIPAPLFLSLCLASVRAHADPTLDTDPLPADTLVDPATAATSSSVPATVVPIKGNIGRRQGLFDFFKTTTASALESSAPESSAFESSAFETLESSTVASSTSANAPDPSSTTVAPSISESLKTTNSNTSPNQNIGSSPTQTAPVSAQATSDNPLTNPIIIASIVIGCLAFLGITLALICFRHTLFPRSFSQLGRRGSIDAAATADTHKPYQEISYMPLVNPIKRLRAKKVVFQYTAAANSDELSVEIGDLVDVTDVVDDNFVRGVLLRTGQEGVFPKICVETV